MVLSDPPPCYQTPPLNTPVVHPPLTVHLNPLLSIFRNPAPHCLNPPPPPHTHTHTNTLVTLLMPAYLFPSWLLPKPTAGRCLRALFLVCLLYLLFVFHFFVFLSLFFYTLAILCVLIFLTFFFHFSSIFFILLSVSLFLYFDRETFFRSCICFPIFVFVFKSLFVLFPSYLLLGFSDFFLRVSAKPFPSFFSVCFFIFIFDFFLYFFFAFFFNVFFLFCLCFLFFF